MKYQAFFTLKDRRQGTTSIIATIHHKGKRWRFATGHVVKPSHWSASRQRVKAGDVLASLINDDLVRITLALGRIVDNLQQAPGALTIEAIRSAWEKSKVAPPEAADIFTTFERWIDDQPTSPQTKKIYGTAKNHLRGFAKAYDLTLTFDSLSVVVMERFVRYLLTVQGMVNTSSWKITKTIKTFLGSTYEKGLHTSDVHTRIVKSRILPKGEDETSMEYLTEAELATVTDLDLADNPRLARVRDLFIFLCWTGIRFGDSQVLTPDHRHGDTLRFTTGKNRSSVVLPLLPEAARVWDSYAGMLPRITNQKGNEYLREILVLADLNTQVTTVRFRGTEKVEETKPKFEAIRFHSAKRSFISLSLSRGASLETLSKITGNSVQTLRVYDVRTGQEAADAILEAWK